MRSTRILFILALLSNGIITWSQPRINEIMTSNASNSIETDFYNFSDWIEIYNSGSTSINLAEYFLSDNEDDPLKWQLPSKLLGAGKYYLIYCDKENTGDHTNFGLSADGETIYLSNLSKEIVDFVTYDKQFPDVSFGRSTTDQKWYYCSNPTPGNLNEVTMATKQASKVDFTALAGFYSASVSLSLTGNEIRYSTNGSEPESTSMKFIMPINISKTQVVKTKSFNSEFLPSESHANTYFINEHKNTLPVVSLSFNPDFFYDKTIGIYTKGSNGNEGNCPGTVANWNQDCERLAYFEYFNTDGIKQISQQVGVKVAGGCTRGRDQKSLSIYARSKYGDKDLDYSFFAEKPDINSFKSVLLRNSGNDQDQTLLRDAIIQALVKTTMDIDCQSYQPTSVYLNGTYFGIMNLREKLDEDYFLTNYNLKSNEIDFLEGVLFSDFDHAYNAIRGSATEYWDIVNFLSNNNLKNDDNYNWVASKLDLQEYINYMTTEIYIGNRDWPGNNLKFWKKKDNGKWRWILFDTDYGFGFRFNDGGSTFESFHLATKADGIDHPNPAWSTLLFRKLIENEEFKKHFLPTFIAHMYSSFDPAWCNYVVDSLSNVIDYEIDFNQKLYKRTKSAWQGYLNTMKKYAVDRQKFMPGYLKSFFALKTDEVTVSVLNTNPSEGKVEVNAATLPMYPFTMKTYKNLPLTLKVLPNKGYHFSHWEITVPDKKIETSPVLESDTSYNMTIRPVFEPVNAIEGIHLNEIASVSGAFHDEFDEKSGFIELYNSTLNDIVLESCFLSDTELKPLRYPIPDGTIIPAYGFLVFYADAEASQSNLHTPFKMDEDGESILLCQKVGNEVNILDSVSFDFLFNKNSFGKYTDGIGKWQHMVNQTPGAANKPEKPIVGFENTGIKYKISSYPNPTNGNIFINLGDNNLNQGDITCQIVDVSGRLVSTQIKLSNNSNSIDLDGLTDGFYFIQVMKKSQIIATKKIILLR